MTNNKLIDLLHNEANKEEFERDTSPRTAAYTNVREDPSTGSTYKLPLEASYARGLTKKYYSAAEITEVLNIALYQLRYLETKIPNLSNYKIKNRKYYTANDFELFQNYLNINQSPHFISTNIDRVPSKLPLEVEFGKNSNDKIDKLLTNFNDLSFQIKKILADSITTRL